MVCMKIYISHSTSFDYEKDLYSPIRQAFGNSHDIYFPHETTEVTSSKDIIKDSDIVLAEVSYPSTGQGIELGWADENNKPIVCLFRPGASVSKSLTILHPTMIEYDTATDMIEKIRATLDA